MSRAKETIEKPPSSVSNSNSPSSQVPLVSNVFIVRSYFKDSMHTSMFCSWHNTSITPFLHLLPGCFVWLLCLSAGRSWASFAGRSRSWWRRSWTSTGFWIPACTLQPTRPSNVFKLTPSWPHTPRPRELRMQLCDEEVDTETPREDDVTMLKCGWVMSFGVWHQQLCVCQ